ncbi:MAG: GNAT family N-acetyltransferase [Chloroflexi bacterium]|nr:GNAT family N-acetyltransferase [Chloroflexota bacterium]
MPIDIRDIEPQDCEWVHNFLLTYAGSACVVSRGQLHQADQLPGFIATYDGIPAALLTYHVTGYELEVVTLHAAQPGHGLGSALLEAARETARQLGCQRLWLITTNDNEPATRFYQRRGMHLVAVHRNALQESRKLKPEIPLTGVDGKPSQDEVEFKFRSNFDAKG